MTDSRFLFQRTLNFATSAASAASAAPARARSSHKRVRDLLPQTNVQNVGNCTVRVLFIPVGRIQDSNPQAPEAILGRYVDDVAELALGAAAEIPAGEVLAENGPSRELAAFHVVRTDELPSRGAVVFVAGSDADLYRDDMAVLEVVPNQMRERKESAAAAR